ncbi:hypothetical protein TVAG_244460 [Trichomonas vaginalis G3]|uniref:DUF4326 domain-containing protein n=1 Tax=Trichomonas vaginalis (strain ATCC PRA-98 / G3) TaxID=412133 RepID=A2ES33_TRIV3|nr:protein of unknown function (DUF4326) [Trichomonas vaginalis G3]EAY04545.1 hypothetical protein TVAG_244460 [Trichomonas vaginalis G3]KAI5508493.1 protein of unknown function (DUF4326) [Trichomonas vaginalis G3]|eukprot:XP_001316768.1 hypothetical protein [Trichomonas vaginalis G3]
MSTSAANVRYPKIVDVHKESLLQRGYKSFAQWKSDEDHLYIGRDMSQYVPGAVGSRLQNPYKVKEYGLERCLELYYEKFKNEDLSFLLEFKELGCWCHNRNDVPNPLKTVNVMGMSCYSFFTQN